MVTALWFIPLHAREMGVQTHRVGLAAWLQFLCPKEATRGLCPQGSSVPTGDLPPTTVPPTTTTITTTTTPRPPPRNVGTRCDLCAKATSKGEQILNELCRDGDVRVLSTASALLQAARAGCGTESL